MMDEVLSQISRRFIGCTPVGRLSIAPEKLSRGQLLQMLHRFAASAADGGDNYNFPFRCSWAQTRPQVGTLPPPPRTATAAGGRRGQGILARVIEQAQAKV